MRLFAASARYSRWDGGQADGIAPDAALAALADDLMEHGDLHSALRNLLRNGLPLPGGGRLRGLRDILQRLRERKRERLERFDLSSAMQDIEAKLEDILRRERQTVSEWLERDDGEFSDEVLKRIAVRNRAALDALPEDAAGRIRALEKHEFLNAAAQRDFIELLNRLRKAMTQTFFNDVEKMAQSLSDGDIARMKDMLRALNDMLVKKIAGEDPDFDGFMRQFGDMFGDKPPQSLNELLEQMRRQMAAAQSLLGSLSPRQREELQSMLADRLGDPEIEAELRKLAKEMDFLDPRAPRYRFGGSDQIDLEAAMQLMKELHRVDDAIDAVQAAQGDGDLIRIDEGAIRELLGDADADAVEVLKQLLKALREAGYLREAGDKWELTPRGSRKIAQTALSEIYARLKRQSLGNHAVPEEGRFGERIEQAKPFEPGDPFHLHMPRTLRNALDRGAAGLPIRLKPEDFEVHVAERVTATATAMLVDQSWSMALRGSFQAAKKVALALHHLVTSQCPRDSFYIIGFAAYAVELKPRDLPALQWDEYVLGTNMQHALLLAERLLARHNAGTKQIIMISDGEPTAHLRADGSHQFAYPPTAETWRATFQAVQRCTRRGIAINTFMLDANYHLKQFMNQMARINGGRVFYASPEQLGEYVLVDYVARKRKRLGNRR